MFRQIRPMFIQIRHGLSAQLKNDTLRVAELGFNIDTNELVIGTENGPHVVVKVVLGPENKLYAEVPNGMLPMCLPDFHIS